MPATVEQLSQAQDDGARFKLANLSDRFSGFERQMDMEVKSRKDADESQLNSIRDNVARLEKTLNSEIKRRVEANKALQGMFEAQMATVQDKLEADLLDRLDQLHVAVDHLNGRVDAVELDFSQAREQYIRDIEDKSAMVSKDAAGLQAAFANERHDRKDRETLIVAKLRDLDGRTVERLASDQRDVDQRFTELREELDNIVEEEEGKSGSATKTGKRFQDYILEEMAALKNGLVVESQTREQADDQIVHSLNHYTQAIQEALRIVNQA